MSAIDNALHDLRGKLLGVPSYQLLGGTIRNAVTPYVTLFPGMPQGRGWTDMKKACRRCSNNRSQPASAP